MGDFAYLCRKHNIYMSKRNIIFAATLAAAIAATPAAQAQFSLSRALQGLQKVAQSVSISDEQMAAYVHQSVEQMDKENKVAPADSPYTTRLTKLTTGLTDVEGIPLNFKVYVTEQVNAFACADGSVRVYTGLMDLMTDDEVLGVIGHEVGHVAHHDSKNAFKKALRTSALKDVLASTSGKVAALTDSQLGALGEALINTKYSRDQEEAADDYGYDFLCAHGKNPWAMALAFEKMQQLEQQSGANNSAMARLFSDHPDTEARIDNIVKRCEADGYARPAAATSSTSKGSATKAATATKSKGSKAAKSASKKTTEKTTATKQQSFTLTPSKLPSGSRLNR